MGVVLGPVATGFMSTVSTATEADCDAEIVLSVGSNSGGGKANQLNRAPLGAATRARESNTSPTAGAASGAGGVPAVPPPPPHQQAAPQGLDLPTRQLVEDLKRMVLADLSMVRHASYWCDAAASHPGPLLQKSWVSALCCRTLCAGAHT